MMPTRWFLLVSLSMNLVGCTQTVATIGSEKITKKELAAREQIVKIYAGDSAVPATETAKAQLTNAFTYAEILKNNGKAVSDQELINEADRIQRSSLMPEKLKEIKEIFKGDENAYRKIYVLPVYVERTLYFDFFLSHPEIQRQAAETAKSFLNATLPSPKSFRELAKDKYFRFTVSPTSGVQLQQLDASLNGKVSAVKDMTSENAVPTAVKAKLSSVQGAQLNAEAQRWIEEIVKPLKPGQVFPQLIDQKEQFWVVRYLKETPSKGAPSEYLFEGARFPKADFQEWLSAEKNKVQVKWH